MDMQELKKQLLEALPEDAKLSDEDLEQIAGGLRTGLSQDELVERLSVLGVTGINRRRLGLLLDAKLNTGALSMAAGKKTT